LEGGGEGCFPVGLALGWAFGMGKRLIFGADIDFDAQWHHHLMRIDISFGEGILSG
jgi:hypothetical protein